MEVWIWGFGLGVWGLGYTVWASGFGVGGFGFQDLGLGILGLGIGVKGLWTREVHLVERITGLLARTPWLYLQEVCSRGDTSGHACTHMFLYICTHSKMCTCILT